MTIANFIKLSSGTMELLSNFGIKMGDFKHIQLYSDYERMAGDGNKTTYIVAFLADKYSMSESSVYRILKRFKSTF